MSPAAPAPARQVGRALIDFFASMSAYANGDLRDEARGVFEARSDGVELPPRDAPHPERLAAIQAIVEDVPQWQFDQLYARVVAENMSPVGNLASAEAGLISEVDPDTPLPRPLDEDVVVPEYWSTVNFHAMPWFSERPRYRAAPVTPNFGKVIAKAGLAAVPKGTDTTAQRETTAAQARVTDVRRVLDMGTGGSGMFMAKLQDRYPDAEMHGIDLSVQGLAAPAAMAASLGRDWVLSHQNAERTNYPDEHFDLVTSYALFHELPVGPARAVLAEAFRLLRPGGEILMGDVPPYRQIPDWQFLLSDWETEGRVEPWWREAASLNRGEVCRQIGFVDVEEYGVGITDYPWVLRARKPTP